MSGKPGRSGRKSMADEVIKMNVITASWSLILRALNSKKLNEDTKRGIALEVVKRTCPQEINHSGSIGLNISEMWERTIDLQQNLIPHKN